jgi:hypothetical protein
MKGKSIFSIFAGIISLALIFGTMAVSCDNGTNSNPTTGSGSGSTTELTYSSATEDLVIVFKEPEARAALASGTSYEIYKDGNRVSHGTITVTDITITFTTAGNQTFTANISNGAITFVGTITIITDNGGSLTVSGSLTKEAQNSSNPFVGTWDSNVGGTLIVTQNTWQYSRIGSSFGGEYTYIGNTATYWYTGNTQHPYVTRLINGVFHTQGDTFYNKH